MQKRSFFSRIVIVALPLTHGEVGDQVDEGARTADGDYDRVRVVVCEDDERRL